MKKLQKWLTIVLVFGVLALAGWRALSLAMADHYARLDPVRALRWRPGHPEALIFEAERLSRAEPTRERAAEFARRALRADPLDGRAYRVLGRLAEANGDSARALALFQIAARRAPRDLPSQAWLIAYYLRTDLPSSALPYLDAMLRVQPELLPSVFPVFAALAAHPETQRPLADLLATTPPWRQQALTMLCDRAPDAVAISSLLELLRKSPGGLDKSELSAWLRRLAREHMWGQAYLTWASELSPEQRKSIGNLFNGSFESEPSTVYGFDWWFGRVAGANIDVLPTSGAGGRQALRVSFEDRRVLFSHVGQLLYLSPGRYRLEGRVRLEELRNERGLIWKISCGGSSTAFANSEPMMGSSGWTRFSLDFEVPRQDCDGQLLQLSLPARTPIEQRIAGRAWFDDMRIVRIP